MSESDDWGKFIIWLTNFLENQLDSDNEEEQKKKEAEEKAAKNKFDDEDTVDQEALAKKKAEEKKKAEAEAQANARVKTTKKVDYDKKFEERQKKLGGAVSSEPTPEVNTKGMSKAAKGMIVEQKAEEMLADQLFGGEAEAGPKLKLNTEKEYKDFGRKTAQILYQGSAPYRIENFYKELSKDIGTHCDSKQIKKIADQLQTLYNDKLKKEKEEEKGKSKKAKASLKGGGAKGYDRNNNPAMLQDVMGADDEYGDEYGDQEGGFKREGEADYDFMWDEWSCMPKNQW